MLGARPPEGLTGTLQGVNAPASKSQSRMPEKLVSQCSLANQGEQPWQFDHPSL
jgi:hypothetical protein